MGDVTGNWRKVVWLGMLKKLEGSVLWGMWPKLDRCVVGDVAKVG